LFVAVRFAKGSLKGEFRESIRHIWHIPMTAPAQLSTPRPADPGAVADTLWSSNRPPRRRAWLLFMPSLVAIICIIVFASRRQPCEPASGTTLHSQQPASQQEPPVSIQRLRIATFNIHSGVGTDGRFDLDRIADALREFDVVGLNEVRGPRPWSADQAEQLATRIGSRWLFAPFERRWFREDFGNGVLSRLPVSRWNRTPLPYTTPKGHGNLLDLTLETRPYPIRILITHIDRKTDHDVQLKTVIDRFLHVAGPVILMGDLNAKRDDPQIAALLRTPDVYEALQSPLNRSETDSVSEADRIDWIFTRELKPMRSEIRGSEISDHPLVCVELEVSRANVLDKTDFSQRQFLESAGHSDFSGTRVSTGTGSGAAPLHTRRQTLK
jgi:endonuclease/exonuclease/phosphatase family metal-dependent hydrolase